MKLENVERNLPTPCSSVRYAKVLMAKLNASISTDFVFGLPIVNSDMLGNNRVYKIGFFPGFCCAASVNVLTE